MDGFRFNLFKVTDVLDHGVLCQVRGGDGSVNSNTPSLCANRESSRSFLVIGHLSYSSFRSVI